MKTYQFAIFAVLGVAIVAAMVLKPKKKCGCGGVHMDDAVVIPAADTE